MNQYDYLIKKKPLKGILLFTIPIYIGQLFQLSYSLIDTKIIGSALGERALAAVGATTALSDLLIEFLNGIACGFGIIIANYIGAKEKEKAKSAIVGTVFLGVLITIAISVICILFLPRILGILKVPEELMADADAYIKIIVFGLIATTLFNIFVAILRAIGDSFTPLLFLILSNLINIGLDLLAVYPLRMGVAGPAYATVIAQVISGVCCYIYMGKKHPEIQMSADGLRINKQIVRQLLPQGMSMGFMISFVTLGSLALQSGINHLGTNIIVAHTAARKITLMFLIPFFALGTALATYCGQNLGAKEYDRIKKGIKDTILAAFAWCLAAITIIFLLSPIMVSILTSSDESEIIHNAVLYLKVNSVLFFLPAAICILRNSMQGLGDTKTPLISSFIELAGKVVFAFLLVPVMGYMGVIISEPVVWAIMVIPLIIGIKRIVRNNYDE